MPMAHAIYGGGSSVANQRNYRMGNKAKYS